MRTQLRAVGLVVAFITGAFIAIQSRINGALGTELHNGIAAALISFLTGLLVLIIILACNRRTRGRLSAVRAAVADRRLVWWQLMGGVSGAFLVTAQGLAVTAIGVATFTVAVVGGQLISSLWVDRIGLGPAGKAPITVGRALGAGIALLAVVIASAGGLGHAGPQAYVLALLPAIAGFGMAWQQAINGRVGVVGGPIVAASINFGVGTVALIIATAVSVLIQGRPAALPSNPWLYLGGLFGVVFIAAAAVVVRWVGVLLLGLTAIAGQLIGSVLVELVVPTGAGLTTLDLVGCALTLVGVAVAALVRR
ncbi:DMT family transporter [Microlunatus elymi]|uniref:DMT family transporter n=1 Tax=Microlunatus elymi TaxID=2596828 RepID=A0A516Q382_9ACTN|nr:DMT family transporter [Microlunatus elymi]QDP97887.1 DMT family transporter [Microlunatus elymi]